MKYKDGSNVKKRAQLSALAKQWYLASVNPVSGELAATKWDSGYFHIKGYSDKRQTFQETDATHTLDQIMDIYKTDVRLRAAMKRGDVTKQVIEGSDKKKYTRFVVKNFAGSE